MLSKIKAKIKRALKIKYEDDREYTFVRIHFHDNTTAVIRDVYKTILFRNGTLFYYSRARDKLITFNNRIKYTEHIV